MHGPNGSKPLYHCTHVIWGKRLGTSEGYFFAAENGPLFTREWPNHQLFTIDHMRQRAYPHPPSLTYLHLPSRRALYTSFSTADEAFKTVPPTTRATAYSVIIVQLRQTRHVCTQTITLRIHVPGIMVRELHSAKYVHKNAHKYGCSTKINGRDTHPPHHKHTSTYTNTNLSLIHI